MLELMFNGGAIALWNFAGVAQGMTKHQTLVGGITIETAGFYNIGFQWTRPFLTSPTPPANTSAIYA
ncbi:hypothetical protein VB712_08030 [Spirulina sp. CCNP1310]|uniref:hypothetical protein n=1 Tax=Spirulina sp. CCNP1310 TaxID=3110249 RepID=UPI002B20CEFF|nr:hypothetical protein [Spirulina sp. CCNP1310]MEA5419176.1 hypothetical protein [Spirulina sp. CCNP1310]